MSRRLLVPFLGACALLTSQALVFGQSYAPSYPPGSPAPPSVPMPPRPDFSPLYSPMPTFPPQPPATTGLTPAVAAAPSPTTPGPASPLPTGGQPALLPAPLPVRSAPGDGSPGKPPAQSSNPTPSGAGPSADDPGGLIGIFFGGTNEAAGCRADGSGSLSNCNTPLPRALPTVGGFFGARYRRAINVPINRTVSYSLFNSNAAAATVVGIAPSQSSGRVLNTVVFVDGGPGVLIAPGGITPFTLAPGGSAVVTANGIVNQATSIIDYAGRGQIQASDYESPRPVNRFYVGAYHNNNVADRLTQVLGPTRVLQDQTLPSTAPEVLTSLVAGSDTFFDAGITDVINTQVIRERGQMTREVIGFEKTLELGGIDGSFGMRLPIFQLTGSTTEIQDVGDLSLIWKAIVCGGFDTEDLVTVGLVLTLPTGPKLITPEGEITSVLIQPWVGYYYVMKQFYLQGFTGVVIPTDSRDTGFSYTNLALGYRFFESRRCNPLISLVAGQIEGHATTAFERPSLDRSIIVNDQFLANAALHVGFGDSSLLTLGFGVPFGGYRPFEYQAAAFFNVLF